MIIEPLDPLRHDRAAFSCGVPQVDNFLQKTANKLTKADNLRVFVMTPGDGTIICFYAVNGHSIHYSELPSAFARNRPGHGNIPAAYICMIGRDERFKGGGYGGDLLADCLHRIARAADTIGLSVAVLDVLDCGDQQRTARRRSLYLEYGFEPFVSDPMRLFLPVSTIRRML